LLISALQSRESLRNQGFRQNARKKSKVQNPYESTTYKRYGFNSALSSNRGAVRMTIPFFVHKYNRAGQFQVKKLLGKSST
jgi:hypothetical protein